MAKKPYNAFVAEQAMLKGVCPECFLAEGRAPYEDCECPNKKQNHPGSPAKSPEGVDS